ncbi:bifunctional proline oxidoreductase-transcriptional repressor protein [Desulfovibrio ferrophilus]|uniref:Bifunctional proline oxidoreductase-transcriptional repressor protein n=1 Tax=Desulfovibrio ferrophilus TaxID=241368 RepID=A0A2Z6AVJ0_9BACT|nr:bifunctional proline oxidoreductase-transcriptional repressor protein [Desulfovibrio ferrophilus]
MKNPRRLRRRGWSICLCPWDYPLQRNVVYDAYDYYYAYYALYGGS